jgi:gas vesicle protein GvpA/GvpJ/GvpM family/gas vesicle protein GvpK
MTVSQLEPVALVDLLDRVLATGVVVTGEVTLSIAGVDLVYLSLNLLLSSVRPDGPGLMALDEQMHRLCEHFGIAPEDLNLDLGPLGTLLPRDR